MVRSTLVPWEARMPLAMETGMRAFDRFRREVDRLMLDCFGSDEGSMAASSTFSPQMNVAETDKEFEITLDLPGMKLEDFVVELREGNLLISGERKEEREERGKTFRRFERSYGHFSRVIPVGPDVQPDQINAQYKNGVLRVMLPKTEAAKAKRIPIKS